VQCGVWCYAPTLRRDVWGIPTIRKRGVCSTIACRVTKYAALNALVAFVLRAAVRIAIGVKSAAAPWGLPRIRLPFGGYAVCRPLLR